MHCSEALLHSCALKNFRNHTDISFSFSPQINGIYGLNAYGKTNLLEALYFLCTGRSFRTKHLAHLIRKGEEFFYLHASFCKENFSQEISLSFNGKEKNLSYQKKIYPHFQPLLGLIPMVLILPEDIQILVGEPEIRRLFLDLHLGQLDPLYVYHAKRYAKALKQRNAALKTESAGSIEIWDNLRLPSALYIQESRKNYIQELSLYAEKIVAEISGQQDQLKMQYKPSLISEDKKDRLRDMHLGYTSQGPQRDELIFFLNTSDVKQFASQGQKRSLVTALRLAECLHFQEKNHSMPLLGIDDFGIHLDARRSSYLLETVMQWGGQLFLTAPSIPSALSSHAHHVLELKEHSSLLFS